MAYVHGYSERELERLKDQSMILADILHSGTIYPEGASVLEAGCGVGAQTVFLTRNSPRAHFTSIDLSDLSLEKAKKTIEQLDIKNVIFKQANIYSLPFKDEAFDHIFVCFVLEHLDDPVAALIELKRVLKAGGTLTAIEGDHGSCFWHPGTPESIQVWNSLVKVQQKLGHDPLIGRRLYPLLKEAGFAKCDVSPRFIYGDQGKRQTLEGMVHKIIVPMVESSKKQILDEKIVDMNTWIKGIHDLSASGTPPDGTFFYTWFKGIALK